MSDAAYSAPAVDIAQNEVCVKGRGRFTWLDGVGKGIEWEEEFVYLLGAFDDQGRVGRWEVWADPLSAWLASQGRRVNE